MPAAAAIGSACGLPVRWPTNGSARSLRAAARGAHGLEGENQGLYAPTKHIVQSSNG